MSNGKTIKFHRLLNILIAAALFCLTAALGIHTLTIGNPNNRFIVFIGAALLFPLPFILELLSKKKISNFVLSVYLTFVFVAAVLGFVFEFYHKFLIYDKLVHFSFGYIGSLFGLLLLCKLGKYREMRPVFVCVMVFAVSLMCGAVWEIFEFMADTFLGQTTQGMPIIAADGTSFTSVNDAMFDLIANFFGALVFTAHYIIHKVTKKNLLIDSMANDFCGEPKDVT